MSVRHAHRFTSLLARLSYEHRESHGLGYTGQVGGTFRSFLSYGEQSPGLCFDVWMLLPESAGNLKNGALATRAPVRAGELTEGFTSLLDVDLFKRHSARGQFHSQDVVSQLTTVSSTVHGTVGHIFYLAVSWHNVLCAWRDGWIDVVLDIDEHANTPLTRLPQAYTSSEPFTHDENGEPICIPFVDRHDRDLACPLMEYLLYQSESLELQSIWHSGWVTAGLAHMKTERVTDGGRSSGHKGRPRQLKVRHTAWGGQHRTTKCIHARKGRAASSLLLAITTGVEE